MERFAEIVKGRTYLHRPNQSLNLYLTATLAIAVAVVIGLGFGHFKGKKNIQNDTDWLNPRSSRKIVKQTVETILT